MASKPTEAFVLKQIEELGGWDVAVFDRVADGETQTAIAQSYGISQGFLSRLIHKDAERVRAFREAKRLWAITLVERTGELVNNVEENKDSIAKVREVAAQARWEASKWDRELFGEDKGDVNVNVIAGDVHLDALRHRMVEASQSVPAVPRRGADAAPSMQGAGTASSPALPAPIDVTPEPAPSPAGQHRLEWDVRMESVRCLDCDPAPCWHAKRAYLKRAQAYADSPSAGPRIIRGIV